MVFGVYVILLCLRLMVCLGIWFVGGFIVLLCWLFASFVWFGVLWLVFWCFVFGFLWFCELLLTSLDMVLIPV